MSGRDLCYEDSVRWLKWKNLSGETAPAHACIGLDPVELPTSIIDRWRKYISLTDENGVNYFRGYKPTSTHETLQSPAMHVFNGPEAVKDGRFGRCTWDFPAIALHRNKGAYADSAGVNDAVPNSHACGPAAGEWHLGGRGSAFTVMSHAYKAHVLIDHGGSAGGVTHPIWVVPWSRHASEGIAGGSLPLDDGVTNPLAAGDNLTGSLRFGSRLVPAQQYLFSSTPTFPGRVFGFGSSGDETYLEVYQTAVYFGVFSATAWCDSGGTIGVEVFCSRERTGWSEGATGFSAYRNWHNTDPYIGTYTAKENICMPFMLALDANDRVLLRNLFDGTNLSNLCFWMGIHAFATTYDDGTGDT